MTVSQQQAMKTIQLSSPHVGFDFELAKRITDALAKSYLDDPDPFCLTWFDKAKGRESPAHVSYCHDGSCDVPGYIEYAQSRGAQLKVVVGEGDFIFCYRSVRDTD